MISEVANENKLLVKADWRSETTEKSKRKIQPELEERVSVCAARGKSRAVKTSRLLQRAHGG